MISGLIWYCYSHDSSLCLLLKFCGVTGCLVGSEEPSAHRPVPSVADGVSFELLKSQGTSNTDTDPETGSLNRQCLTAAVTDTLRL